MESSKNKSLFTARNIEAEVHDKSSPYGRPTTRPETGEQRNVMCQLRVNAYGKVAPSRP
jgi:hypothetical protein